MKAVLLLTCVTVLAFAETSNAQIIYPADNGFAVRSVPANQIAVGPADTVGSPWTFSSKFNDAEANTNESGIAPNGTQNLSDAPNGQSAFLQDISSISQMITLPTGIDTVSISFDWEGRTPVSYINSLGQPATTGQNEITVTLGGILLFDGTPNALDNVGAFQFVTTNSMNFSGGSYDLVFSGVSSGVATNTFTDKMTFIDNIQVNSETVPEPSSPELMALGGVLLFVLSRRLKSGKG